MEVQRPNRLLAMPHDLNGLRLHVSLAGWLASLNGCSDHGISAYAPRQRGAPDMSMRNPPQLLACCSASEIGDLDWPVAAMRRDFVLAMLSVPC